MAIRAAPGPGLTKAWVAVVGPSMARRAHRAVSKRSSSLGISTSTARRAIFRAGLAREAWHYYWTGPAQSTAMASGVQAGRWRARRMRDVLSLRPCASGTGGGGGARAAQDAEAPCKVHKRRRVVAPRRRRMGDTQRGCVSLLELDNIYTHRNLIGF